MSTLRYEDIVDSPLKPVLTRRFKPLNELLKELIIRDNPKAANLNWDHLGFSLNPDIGEYQTASMNIEEIDEQSKDPVIIETLKEINRLKDELNNSRISQDEYYNKLQELSNGFTTSHPHYRPYIKVGILPEHQDSYKNPDDNVMLTIDKIHFEDYFNEIFGNERNFKIERLEEVKQWFDTMKGLGANAVYRERKASDVLTTLTVTINSGFHSHANVPFNNSELLTGIDLFVTKGIGLSYSADHIRFEVTLNFISKDTRATSAIGDSITDTTLSTGENSVIEKSDLRFTTEDLHE